jgi:hypothetical protein
MSPEIVAYVLVCAASTPMPDCSITSATDVLGGLPANTPIECMMNGQALIAQSQLNLKGQYLKIVCMHVTESALDLDHDGAGLAIGARER